jgi:hypothetical protein
MLLWGEDLKDRILQDEVASLDARFPLTKWLRQLFHWRYSSVFGVGLVFCGVGAMIASKFGIAIVCYLPGGIWLIGWWLTEHPYPKTEKGPGSMEQITKSHATTAILRRGFVIRHCRISLWIHTNAVETGDPVSLSRELVPGK